MNEFQGRWIQKGLIRVPVPVEEPEVVYTSDPIEAMLSTIEWTPEKLRAAHAGYVSGKRDVVTLAGHHEWERRYRAARRRSVLSAEDRRWCEKAAQQGWRVQWERANRHGGASEEMVYQAQRMC